VPALYAAWFRVTRAGAEATPRAQAAPVVPA
jgi:hypothetical protein